MDEDPNISETAEFLSEEKREGLDFFDDNYSLAAIEIRTTGEIKACNI